MKRTTLMITAALALTASQVYATGIDFNPLNHATKTELAAEAKTRADGDKNLQSQIDQKGYDINTQAKYTTSVNNDLQASKAAGVAAYNQVQGQVGQLNDKIDQTRTDGAAAIGQTNTAVKAVDDKANAINSDLQATKAVGVAVAGALNGKIDSAVATQGSVNDAQHANNVQQQNQINAVQGAAQTANDRATNLEGRADTVEGAVRQTNAQVAVTDARSINNAVRLDGTETNIGKNTAAIGQHTHQIATINDVNAAQQTQINNNTSTNVQQSGQIKDLQDYSRDMDSRLGGRLDSQQSQISKNSRDIKIARNMASAALAVAGQQFCTGTECGFQTAVSASTIDGTQALAIGMGGAVSENVFLNAAFTKSGSVTGGVVSGTYRFK